MTLPNDMLSSTRSFLAGLGLSQRHFWAVALDISNRVSDQHFESTTRMLPPLDETKLNPQNEEEPASGNEPKQESQAATAEDVAVADEAPSKAEPTLFHDSLTSRFCAGNTTKDPSMYQDPLITECCCEPTVGNSPFGVVRLNVPLFWSRMCVPVSKSHAAVESQNR